MTSPVVAVARRTGRSTTNGLAAGSARRWPFVLAALLLAASVAVADHGDLDAARDRVTDLATSSFAGEYETAFDGGLRAVIDELGAVSEATVRDVFVSDVSGSTASAVVVVDSTVRSSAGVRELTGSYLQIELERVDGRWLVSAATAVGAEGEAVNVE